MEVIDVDERTMKYMQGHPTQYPIYSVDRIVDKLVAKLRSQSKLLRRTFRQIDTDKNNRITLDEFTALLKKYFSPAELTDHEVMVIMRRFDRDRNGAVDYNEFAEVVLGTDYAGSGAGGGKEEEDVRVPRVLDGPCVRTPTHPPPPFFPSQDDKYAAVASAKEAEERHAHHVRKLLLEFSQAFMDRKGLLTQAFRMLDTDFSGTLDRSEFHEALSVSSRHARFTVPDEDLGILVDSFFPPGVESLDYAEFMDVLWRVNLEATHASHH